MSTARPATIPEKIDSNGNAGMLRGWIGLKVVEVDVAVGDVDV
jgi:hypothetical protein